jgi:hypothetical protein
MRGCVCADVEEVMNDAQAYQMGYFVGLLIGSIGIGAICGLLPFFVAKSRNRSGFGVAALLTCMVCGFLGGIIFAGPAMIVFTFIVSMVKNLDPFADPDDPMRHEPPRFATDVYTLPPNTRTLDGSARSSDQARQ